MITTCRTRSAAALAALFGPNGIERDEWQLLAALALIARGLWTVWQPGAYLAPGIVLLWLALPARVPFVHRVEVTPTNRRERQLPPVATR